MIGKGQHEREEYSEGFEAGKKVGFKAGEQQGIEKGRKEVVDSFLGAEIHSNPHSMLKAFNKILKAWQAFLKGIDKEE